MGAGCSQCCRQFRVLAWKNALVKVRGWQTLLLELFVPILIIVALGGVKSAIGQTTYNKNYPANYHDNPKVDNLFVFNPPLCTDDNLVWSCRQPKACLAKSSAAAVANPKQALSYLSSCQARQIAVAPSTAGAGSASDSAAQAFVKYMNQVSPYAAMATTFQYFPSESAFLTYMGSNTYTVSGSVYSSAVIFNAGAPAWDYTVRYNRTYYQFNRKVNAPDTSSKAEDISVISPSGGGYLVGGNELNQFNALGVYALMDAVHSFVATQAACPAGAAYCSPVTVNTLGVANFPNPSVTNSGFWGGVGFLFALLMIIALLLPLSNVIKALVQEKETKMREGMLMMALRGDALWLSWLLNFMLLFLPLSIVLTIASRQLFQYSNAFYIWCYFMVYFVATTSYGILVSAVFSKSRTAAIIGNLVFFMGFFIFIGLQGANPSRSQILAACLHPATAFTYGTNAFSEYEGARVGVTQTTWNVSQKYNITFQDCLTMMLVDAIWMGIMAWYLAQVLPSEFGTHKPWYFLVLPSYWCGSCGVGKTDTSVQAAQALVDGDSMDTVEPVIDTLSRQVTENRCVDIRGLVKTFHTPTGPKTAVDGLNLTMYSGQITALLGHNGAGKTTAIGMLTGLFPPSSGTAVVEGLDINESMDEIRRNLGVCPQHDILYPNLTVEEHLQLFAAFKGVPGDRQKDEVEKMIQSVGLTEKRKAYSRTLSGGQKRKLSVAIAFIGDSRIVFLDEPTSGMDPYSRRFTWNVIRSHREGRVVVLTTHFMDEADLLGDRIAIMGDGKLRCCGSSLFLKNLFGVGYNMTIEKVNAIGFDSAYMKTLVTTHVPEAKLLTDVGTEITFQLPFSSSGQFVALFEYMDANLGKMGVRSYGMSVTTLEEVFIKVAEGTKTQATAEAGRDGGKQSLVERKQSMLRPADEIPASSPYPAGTGNAAAAWKPADMELGKDAPMAADGFSKVDDSQTAAYFVRHMSAMLRKRMLYFIRDSRSWIFQYVLPVMFVLIGMLVMKFAKTDTSQPKVALVQAGAQQVYNRGVGQQQLPTPYNSAPTFCLNRHGIFASNDDSATVYTPCRNVTYFTTAASTNATTFRRGAKTFRGNAQVTQTMLLSNLVNNAVNEPLVPVRGAVNISYMSYYLLDNPKKFAAATVGALSIPALGVNGTRSNGGIVGVDVVIHGNFTCQYAGPLYSALVGDAVLKSYSPTSSVTFSLHPLPLTLNEQTVIDNYNVNLVATFILLAIPYVPAAFATFIVREREVKAKHQQLVSGVSVPAYWLAGFVWDNLTYQVTVWMIVILVSAFPNTDSLSGSNNIGKTIGLLILFGSAVSGFTYTVSFMFSTPSGAQIIIIFVVFILGLVLTIVGEVLRLIPTTRDIYMNVLRYIFALFPPFCLGDGLTNLALLSTYSLLELKGGATYKSGDWNITGMDLTFLAWETVVYLGMAIAYEYLSEMPLLQCSGSSPMPTDLSLRDEDVLAEEERVRSGGAEGSVILVKDVKKVYRGGKYAVRGVSLGIPNGECFGLLGINGAGKSSCLNMLSGEFRPTSGEAYLAGHSLLTDVHTCRRKIGFCPQFDALFELLTAREHLQLYARIKGIVEQDIPKVVDAKISEMGLTEYADRLAGTYSGGNKRKLSVAIAMIGEPSIVFLDEPSTGMDPVARRFMWEIISDIVTKREKCSVILTTHSMEECEALCTRIGIMVGGVLRCLGSSQRLRTRYGHGFQIEIGLMIPDPAGVAAQADIIANALRAAGGAAAPGANGEVPVRQEELLRVFEALGRPHWGARVEPNGTGAELAAAFSGNGAVAVNHVASWWVQEEQFDALCAFLGQTFGGFTLRERQNSRVRVEIDATDPATGQRRRFATMFASVEAKKSELKIQEYSIAQTSLEQIFNQFAAQQEEEKGPAGGGAGL